MELAKNIDSSSIPTYLLSLAGDGHYFNKIIYSVKNFIAVSRCNMHLGAAIFLRQKIFYSSSERACGM